VASWPQVATPCYRGFDANDQVHDELVAQNITTPEDASIPNALVDDKDTAHSMAEIIEVHALEATGAPHLRRDGPLCDPRRQTLPEHRMRTRQ
jgi:hypothetical protein